MVPRTPSPSQRLATLALGRDVRLWLRERRPASGPPSFRELAKELRVLTGGQVDVTDQTLANWWSEISEPSDGEAATAVGE